jgi:hypothetical protein
MDVLPWRDTLMAYPMLGIAVRAETPKLIHNSPYFYNRKEKEKNKRAAPKPAGGPFVRRNNALKNSQSGLTAVRFDC